jgi:predicted DNA-binding transcriptional regulator AlpA
MSRQCDPVGAPEIAERLGVQRRTVDQWRQRSLGFPAPRWRVGGRPAWNWDDVESWAAQRPTAATREQRA